jgi:hypothetical protein
MNQRTIAERADHLSRRRARMLPMLAVMFLLQQSSFFFDRFDTGARPVDHIKIGAWVVLSIVLLLALATGGFWLKPKRIRDLMDDDNTRANRAEAFRIGFLVTMIAGIGLYFASLFEPVSGREAIHILMTFGIASALLRFGFLERRALKHG